MTTSQEAKLIDNVAVMINSAAEQVQSTVPHVGMALRGIAISVGQAGEKLEQARVQQILDGTHPALRPVKRMLLIQSRNDRMYDKFLRGDLKLQELKVGHVDETELSERHHRTHNEYLFKRFVGVMYRRLYFKRGAEEQTSALSCWPQVEESEGIPTGSWVFDGDITIQFVDAPEAFEHTLTLGKHYIQHDSNTYKLRSVWMDEEVNCFFNTIGWMWLQRYVMAPAAIANNIRLEDYIDIPVEEMLAQVVAIPNVLSLAMFNHTTMYYPGDTQEFLPKCRVDVSYHYYSGSDDHKLTIEVFPDDNLIALGLNGNPQRRSVPFHDAPSPIQKWIKENIEAAMLETIEAVKREHEDIDPS
jgi:hypothetical protein